VTLRLRETVLRRNGSPVQMDVAPVLRQNRVFLPARFVAEAFGVPRENIVWDGERLAVFGFDGSTRVTSHFELEARRLSGGGSPPRTRLFTVQVNLIIHSL